MAKVESKKKEAETERKHVSFCKYPTARGLLSFILLPNAKLYFMIKLNL